MHLTNQTGMVLDVLDAFRVFFWGGRKWWKCLFEMNFLVTQYWAFLVIEQMLRNQEVLLQVNTNESGVLENVNNAHSFPLVDKCLFDLFHIQSWFCSSLSHISSECWLVVLLITLLTTIALINWMMWLELCTAAQSRVSTEKSTWARVWCCCRRCFLSRLKTDCVDQWTEVCGCVRTYVSLLFGWVKTRRRVVLMVTFICVNRLS